MHSHDEPTYEKRARAGLIPFMKMGDGCPHYLMMVSSDPKFGGPRPMISKGKIEGNETQLECAIREAEEELGFKTRNARGDFIPLFAGRVELFSGAYFLTVFGVEIQDRYDFDKWCDETEFVVWMTLEEFREKGRRDHIRFIEELERKITS
jgi:8-oxo-dGTP pyrophosphatase MutT (NUDIX family)